MLEDLESITPYNTIEIFLAGMVLGTLLGLQWFWAGIFTLAFCLVGIVHLCHWAKWYYEENYK